MRVSSRSGSGIRILVITSSRKDAGRLSGNSAIECPGSAGSCVGMSGLPHRGLLGSLAVVTAIVMALPLWRSVEAVETTAGLVLLGLLALVPASDLAMALINRTVMAILGPRPLPRMALRNGIPKELRTIVAIPTLLTNQQGIEEQVERLEVHYLANWDDDLRFALLSDWRDAPSESIPGDAELLATAVEGIARLISGRSRVRRWFTFRAVSPQACLEQVRAHLDGWERKRGKLHELNQLLRGSTHTTFVSVGGQPPEGIPSVRYVITLDATHSCRAEPRTA